MSTHGAGVVHCPNSNFALRSGVCDVRALLDKGIRVGLGTDVGGGTNPSVLDAMRQALSASVAACHMHDERAGRTFGVEKCGKEDGAGGDGGGAGGGAADGKQASLADDKKQLGVDLEKACGAEDGADGGGDGTGAGGEERQPLTLAEVFHLATQGGAEVLGLGDDVGNFEPGKAFDALVVNAEDSAAGRSAFDVWRGDSSMEVFQKFVFLGDDRNIEHVFVAGRRVL